MRGVRKRVRRDRRAGRRRPVGRRRRGLRPGRRERRRQEHADGDPRRRAGPRRGVDDARRPALRAAQPARRPPRRRRDDLPGAVARAAPDRDGEHPARRGADALGLLDRGRMRELAAARARAARPRGHRRPTSPSARCRSPAQQLVEIARAIAVGCRVLVLDEPTSSLGRDDVEQLFALLRRLKAQGHAIVYISHFLEEVKTIADRFAVLRDGRNAGGGVTAGGDARRDRRADGRAAPGDLFPRTPRAGRRGDPRQSAICEPGFATLLAAPRRGARHRRPGRRRRAPGCCARCSASTRSSAAGCASASTAAARLAADRSERGRGDAGAPGWACSARIARARGSRSA